MTGRVVPPLPRHWARTGAALPGSWLEAWEAAVGPDDATPARAPQENARAAELNPDDPSPYVNEIFAALVLGCSDEAVQQIWKEIITRDPHHYGAHHAALQYWCAKWRGSEERAMAAAYCQWRDRAAHRARQR
ncbi:hypothetical protein [Streptomyces sp. NPDC051546]|uniref:hypothetical protein n=1 Tax=Streptomyces sp. NPDC051546 TaxID=3365655 RepID=UPI0037A20C8B